MIIDSESVDRVAEIAHDLSLQMKEYREICAYAEESTDPRIVRAAGLLKLLISSTEESVRTLNSITGAVIQENCNEFALLH